MQVCCPVCVAFLASIPELQRRQARPVRVLMVEPASGFSTRFPSVRLHKCNRLLQAPAMHARNALSHTDAPRCLNAGWRMASVAVRRFGPLRQCCADHADTARQIYASVAQHVYHLLLHSAEANVVQSCCTVLEHFLGAGGAAVLSWGGTDPGAAAEMLLRCFEHVLRPGADESAAATVEGFAVRAVRALRESRPEVPARLLQLCAARALSCQTQVLRGQLLVVVTRCAAPLSQQTWRGLRLHCKDSVVLCADVSSAVGRSRPQLVMREEQLRESNSRVQQPTLLPTLIA